MTLPPDQVDVVIIGAGIQGLFALEAILNLGLQAVLVDTADLGNGETGHSQAILHRGGIYDDLRKHKRELVVHFSNASAFWKQPEIERHLAGLTTDGVHYGYRLAENLSEKVPLLEALDSEGKRDQQFPLKSPCIAGCFISAEKSVDVARLLQRLKIKYTANIRKIQRVTNCRSTTLSTILTLELPSGESVEVFAQRVIVAVGRDHKNVWPILGIAEPPPHVTNDYRNRPKWNFLALRGPGARLPALNAFLPDMGNTSIVSRQRPPLTTWLMTSDGMLDSANGWLRKRKSLAESSPSLGEWGRILLAQVWKLFPDLAAFKNEFEYHLFQVPEPQTPKEFVAHVPDPWTTPDGRFLILHPCRLTLAPQLAANLANCNSVQALLVEERWTPSLNWGGPVGDQVYEYWEHPSIARWARCP